MSTLLRIDSGLDPAASVSRRLTTAFTEAFTRSHPEDGRVITRDLQADPPPHLPFFGLHFPTRDGVPSEHPSRVLQDTLIEELLSADAVVIGAPLYNYSVPSTVKAWMDYVHVPGRTAMESDGTGPLVGKPAVVLSSRGAAYDSESEAALDHGVPALRALLGSAMGMTVEAITVDRTLAHALPELDAERASVDLEAALEEAAAKGTGLTLS